MLSTVHNGRLVYIFNKSPTAAAAAVSFMSRDVQLLLFTEAH